MLKRTLPLVLVVLFARGVRAQDTLAAPTNVQARQVTGTRYVMLTWTPPVVAAGVLTYRVHRIGIPVDTSGMVLNDTLEIEDDNVVPQYMDHTALPCYRYLYSVSAELETQGRSVESPSSDQAEIQIKGGVNAVVIFHTLPAVAVAGSPFEYQVRACDANDSVNPLHYAVMMAPSGMRIDSTGLLTWNVPIWYAGRSLTVKIIVVDAHQAMAQQQLDIRVVHLLSYSVTGVVSAGGVVVPPVDLALVNLATNVGVRTTTGVGGVYLFTGLDSGTYKLKYQVHGAAGPELWYPAATTMLDGSPIVLGPRLTVMLDTIHLVLPVARRVHLRGHVTDGHSAVAYARVQAFDVRAYLRVHARPDNVVLGSPRFHESASMVTGSDGAYDVLVDSGGSYVVLASASGYEARFVGTQDGGCTSPFCAPTYAPARDTTLPEATMAPSDTSGQQIVGTVTSLADASRGVQAMLIVLKLAGGTITSGYSGGLVPFDVMSSDTAGNFTINSIPRDTTPGVRYMLQALPYDGYVPAYFAVNDSAQNTALWEHALAFALDTAKRDPVVVNVRVQPLASGAGAISGTVEEATVSGGRPSAHAFVYAVDQATAMERGYAIADDSGAFAINNLPAGTYMLFGDKVGFHYALESSIAVGGGDSAGSTGHYLMLSREINDVRVSALMPQLPLLAVYPNPARGQAVVRVFGVVRSVKVYDVLGRVAADLTSAVRAAGQVTVSGGAFPAGLYMVVVEPATGFPVSTSLRFIH